MKVTREFIAARKEAAVWANFELPLKSPMVRHFIQPNKPSASKVAWLGSKALHKRGDRDNVALHRKYAMS